MPQCINRRAGGQPYGRGSLPTDLLDVAFRTRRRAAKINEGERLRLHHSYRMMERHHDAELKRKEKLMTRIDRGLEERRAYIKVLDEFKQDKMKTLQWGYDRHGVASSVESFRRVQLENRLYDRGFSVKSLYPEVVETIDGNKPDKLRQKFHRDLYCRAKRISDFLIDRRVTDRALRRERGGGPGYYTDRVEGFSPALASEAEGGAE